MFNNYKVTEQRRKMFLSVSTCLSLGLLLFVFTDQVRAERMSSIHQLAKIDSEDAHTKEKQIVELNKSFKNVIEENQQLADKNSKLEEKIKRLRGEKIKDKGLYNNLKEDRDALTDSLKRVQGTNQRYSKKLKSLEKNVNELKLANERGEGEVRQLRQKITSRAMPVARTDEAIMLASVVDEEVVEREERTLDLLSKIDAFAEQDARLRSDAAKAHYNMGNIYFHRGEFELAVREYYQAVVLMPKDPDSHFNLAFVSGEHLEDYRTALKHYKMYLYLSPRAKDVDFVREKLVEAQLHLHSIIDSPIDVLNEEYE